MIVGSLSLQARFAAGALVALLWAAPAAGVWLWQSGKASAAYERGQADSAALHATDALAAVDKMLAEIEARDARLLVAARADGDRIVSALNTTLGNARKLTGDLSRHAAENPLSAGCRADAERVRVVNAARDPDAREATP